MGLNISHNLEAMIEGFNLEKSDFLPKDDLQFVSTCVCFAKYRYDYIFKVHKNNFKFTNKFLGYVNILILEIINSTMKNLINI